MEVGCVGEGKNGFWKQRDLDSNISSATYLLYNFWHVMQPLCASVSCVFKKDFITNVISLLQESSEIMCIKKLE